MSADPPIGPLLACAIADAYGAGFEFASRPYIKKHNRLQGYTPHPKFQRPEGSYTDDTQMAMALIEHMLSGDPWTPLNLANRWVTGFHRDERTGYAKHFYDLLLRCPTGTDLYANIQPHSEKNGGSMRAFPVGYMADPKQVRDYAMMQASLTHATMNGMLAAAAAALMFHHRYHRLGPKTDLVPFLNKWVPGIDWGAPWSEDEPTGGVPTVQKAIAVFLKGHSLADVLQMAVALTGDTDTIAAIAAPAAAVCSETRNALPQVLIDKLEDGPYGRFYIQGLDTQMCAQFLRGDVAKPKQPPSKKSAVKPAPKQDLNAEVTRGPLDFLFDGYED